MNPKHEAREVIRKGTSGMPGFQYTFEPEQIESTIAYLSTLKWLCTTEELRALIERPYSREPQAVGAVYDRPGFVVQSHTGGDLTDPDQLNRSVKDDEKHEVISLSSWFFDGVTSNVLRSVV